MALKFDKDAFLETVNEKKDPIFIAVLVVLLGVGGWYVYQWSNQSVEQIINEVTQPRSPGAGGATQQEINPEEIVSSILSKRSAELYSAERNPFGSPEEQLQQRQQVQAAYSRGVDLFRSGQYEAAIEQFDRVIALDVTETRISYPVLPSEYKRRAQRENAKQNFDRIYQSAQSDIAEGDRLMSAGNREKALETYSRASENLESVISSDPQGEAIGTENIQKLKDLQQQVDQKLRNLLSNMLQQSVDQAIADANQAMNSNDYILMTNTLFQISQVNTRLQQNDPNATLISEQKHTQLENVINSLRNKIQSGVPTLTQQAQQTFAEGISNQNLQKTQEAIRAMNQAISFNPDDQQLKQQMSQMISQRAEMVIAVIQDFINNQKQIIRQEDYDNFELDRKLQLLQEIAQLKSLGGMLDSAKRNQIVQLEKELSALRLPPPVTQAYEVISIKEDNGQFEIEVIDKTSRNNMKRTLRRMTEGRRDRTTGITLKQVDMDNGFVILSKTNYMDAKVALPSNQ